MRCSTCPATTRGQRQPRRTCRRAPDLAFPSIVHFAGHPCCLRNKSESFQAVPLSFRLPLGTVSRMHMHCLPLRQAPSQPVPLLCLNECRASAGRRSARQQLI